MAIAEAEPKKSEVAVTSAGVSDGLKDKVLNSGKNFARNKGYACSSTSTSVGNVKSYNLYDNIKGFRFEMPDGWNDEDIGLFVTCCWEKKDDFSKAIIDKTKIWADIAQSGAKKSKNPSLFTINSCLELAERIRYYVSKNKSAFIDNEPFMKFHSDVKSLLPYFSDNFVTNKVTEVEGKERKIKCKTMNGLTSELLNNDSDLGDMIHDLTIENAVAIRNGNPNVWAEMSDKLKEILGINTDSKTILEAEKNKIISDVNKMEEKGIDRKQAFIERSRGFIEVFDYLTPKHIKVSDYLSTSVDSTMSSSVSDNDVPKGRRLSSIDDEALSTIIDISQSENDDKDEETTHLRKPKIGRALKYRKTSKSMITDGKTKSEMEVSSDGNQEIPSEPSSTTSFDELSQSGKTSEQEIVASKVQNELTHINKSNEDWKTFSPTKKTTKERRRRKRERPTVPQRIMPTRVARSKVVSYSLSKHSSGSKKLANKNKIPEAGENISENNGVESDHQKTSKRNNYQQNVLLSSDSDSEDMISEFKSMKSIKNNSKQNTNVANPDTTTDLDDLRNTEDSYLKRLNRKRKDNITKDEASNQEDPRAKVRVVHADSTMKNLVVKLVDCQHLPNTMEYSNIGSINGMHKQLQEKTSTFGSRMRPERSTDDRLIEETVVMAKDVVDSEYNPSSDSAKLVSSEHLNKGQRSALINEGKRITETAIVSLSPTSLKESTSFSLPMPGSSPMENSLHVTKHHVSPFCESSKHNEGSTSASADSASNLPEEMCVVNRSLNFCSVSQDNSVRAFTSFAETSGQLEANQRPSTSSGNPSTSKNADLESALATMQKCRKELLSKKDFCAPNANMVQNRFLSDIQDAKLPDWFDNFVTDFRKHEAWKIQQLLKMQQELADVEHRKVILLEKILGSLINQ